MKSPENAIQLVKVLLPDRPRIEIVRSLFMEYAQSLNFSLCFQDFDRELANLPGEYSPPSGLILLAYVGEKPAGCIALRKIEDSVCEMKRLYLKPEARGKGLGKKLAEEIIAEAVKMGYSKMRLDTVPSMKEAISLYRSLGFKEVAAYRPNPIEGALYMELDLHGSR